MPDRMQVIKGLMELHGSKETMSIIADAIALLREQKETDATIEPCKSCQEWDCYGCTEWRKRTGRR